MTQLKEARNGVVTEAIRVVSEDEGLSPETVRERVVAGRIVIPRNKKHEFMPKGIGEGLRVKVNANIGTSKDHAYPEEELEKLRLAIECGADAVMDLSTGGDLDEVRKTLLGACDVTFGTVPIYQAVSELVDKGRSVCEMGVDELFKVIEKHAEDGVDFITVHCGVTREALERLSSSGRIGGIVSRGGAILANWMLHHKKENPLYENYDRLLDIAEAYDVTLSLGDGLRPGAIDDATDGPQIEELMTLGELRDRAVDRGVQVMIEGPGHVPIDQIEANVQLEKRICKGSPFYILGPLPTDITPGYDHITSAIGGAVAAMAGADFICYVTPAEHLRLPDLHDVKEGVIAARIAAHVADIGRGIPGARSLDREMSMRRKNLDWDGMFEMAIDPGKAKEMKLKSEDAEKDVCTMCGDLCAINLDNIVKTRSRREPTR
ncbi:MAG: phosphomethylpyrimidine synthase ThiC [Candidatus Glassbacteria bacterium]